MFWGSRIRTCIPPNRHRGLHVLVLVNCQTTLRDVQYHHYLLRCPSLASGFVVACPGPQENQDMQTPVASWGYACPDPGSQTHYACPGLQEDQNMQPVLESRPHDNISPSECIGIGIGMRRKWHASASACIGSCIRQLAIPPAIIYKDTSLHHLLNEWNKPLHTHIC